MFLVHGGKCLLHKAVHKWGEKRSKRFAGDEEVETEVRKGLRQQSKRLLCCGLRRTVIQWDKLDGDQFWPFSID
jgi:hypothetical protein